MSDLKSLLAGIYEKRGELTAEAVLEEAKPKAHPLHSRFCWDNAEAGHKYRLIQAEELIRSVKVTHAAEDPSDDTAVRQWHAVRRDKTYEPIEKLMGDDIARELLLRHAEREWRALHRRYSHLAEFLEAVRRDVA